MHFNDKLRFIGLGKYGVGNEYKIPLSEIDKTIEMKKIPKDRIKRNKV